MARDLNNLADLLKDEVRAGRMGRERLTEAREYAARALAIVEQIGDLSLQPWATLSILADIAEMEGQAEQARDYRRRERETFAAFAGNRYHIDRQFGQLIAQVVAAAGGDDEARAAVEGEFPKMEAGDWGGVPPVIRRIWAGERDWHALAEDLDRQDSLFVLRVLEEMGAGASDAPAPSAPGSGGSGSSSGEIPEIVQQLLALLPQSVAIAVLKGDQAAFDAAMQSLSAEEQAQARTVLRQLGVVE
jgi:hypothetical protein